MVTEHVSPHFLARGFHARCWQCVHLAPGRNPTARSRFGRLACSWTRGLGRGVVGQAITDADRAPLGRLCITSGSSDSDFHARPGVVYIAEPSL